MGKDVRRDIDWGKKAVPSLACLPRQVVIWET